MKTNKILAVFGNVAFYGQERANLQVFELLKDSGYEILLAVNDLGFQWHLKPEVEARGLAYKKMRFSWNLVKTLNFKMLKSYLVNIPKSNYQLYRLIKKYRPDYIHVCNDTHVMTLLPVLFFNKTKLIYRLGDKPSAHLSVFHAFLWKRGIVPRVDAFVCISNYIKEELKKSGGSEEKITVIYNYPPSRPKIHSEDLPKKDNEITTFTFIGQLSKDKGIDLLIDAFLEVCALHKNCRLLIAGRLDHDTQFTEILRDRVDVSEFRERIMFLNQVKNIEALFEITDINIIPSVVDEALSNVIVEAKANATASIVFPSGGLPELVTHKGDGYITSEKSVAELVKAMQYYINHRPLILKHSKMALENIEALEISYFNFKQKWLQVYE